MPDWLSPALALATLVLVALLLWRATRPRDDAAQRAALDELKSHTRGDSERLERELRDELGRQAQTARTDLSTFQQMLLTQSGDVARTQNEQIDSFRTQLAAMQQAVSSSLAQATQALASQSQAAREAQDQALRRFADGLGEQLRALTQANDQRLGEMRQGMEQRLVQVQAAVDQRLAAIQQDNEKKLEQMRATVDEKLHATLEQRLGESFKQVADRLEQVHKGLGEMQTLARDVGSLNRVLTNVKTRGIFGEVQLAALLEQVFTLEQYATNVETVPGSGQRVEFAVRLPGARDGAGPTWLPIDSKFPREDYERLLDAQEQADSAAAEAAGRAIETQLRKEARTIREKYVAAPHTTDFAILFVPTEGLYAEALRRPGLVEALQREHRITLAGPTTLLAMLNSLQMGFRTLALEKRSAEVWTVLGAVKTEFGKFGEVLAKVKKKLDEAGSSIESAERRTRVMARELKAVEALPEAQAVELLPSGDADDERPGAAGA